MAVTESKGTRAVLVAAQHVPNEHVGVRVPVMGCGIRTINHWRSQDCADQDVENLKT